MIERKTLEEVGKLVKQWATDEELEYLFGETDNLELIGIAFLDSCFAVREVENGKVIYRTQIGEFEIVE